MRTRRTVLLVVLALGGCLMEAPDEIESSSAGIARAGDWTLPDDVARIGDQQYLAYDEAGPWNDGRACSGGLLEGTRVFGDYLLREFDGISSYGGYSCRRNTGDTSQLSVHGTGRALDLMIPMDDGRADNDVGDPVANWLVTHSELVGVQYIVWDRTDWGAHRDPPKYGDYGGPIPHVDHIHMELTEEGAAMHTPWFTDRDGDDVRNEHDNCPDVANAQQEDRDHDGLGNRCDNCPGEDNPGQGDRDGDGVGNTCDDCPDDRNAGQLDSDDDGRGNVCDICPQVADRHQEDTDRDGHGDACDADDDGDDVRDAADNCPLVRNAGQRDTDADGIGDACQGDDDGDGVADADDLCPRTADPLQADANGDGRGDACDDRDDDGVHDAFDLCPDVADFDQSDTDADGIGDACDDHDDGAPQPDDEAGNEVPPTDDDTSPDLILTAGGEGGCSVAHGAPRGLLTLAMLVLPTIARRRAKSPSPRRGEGLG